MDLVSPLREAKGVMKNSTKRSEYIGTFIKASGAARTMRFTTAAANLGHARTAVYRFCTALVNTTFTGS